VKERKTRDTHGRLLILMRKFQQRVFGPCHVLVGRLWSRVSNDQSLETRDTIDPIGSITDLSPRPLPNINYHNRIP